MARDIAWSHHERYDGARLSARACRARRFRCAAAIVALADVYDALTTKRVYKPAFTPRIGSPVDPRGTRHALRPRHRRRLPRREADFVAVQERFTPPEKAVPPLDLTFDVAVPATAAQPV